VFRIYIVQLGEPVCLVIIMHLFGVTTQNSVRIWQRFQYFKCIFYFVSLFPGVSFNDFVNYIVFIDEWK
jgi:hypothetical protein